MSNPVEQLSDAFDAAEDNPDVPSLGFYDRDTGEVDAQGAEIARALIAAGWTPPVHADTPST